jgi:preprotein translocase subunit SecA
MALHLNDSYNNNRSIIDFDRTTLLFEDDFQAQIQTLGKFIEKTVELLRWRPDNIDINQHDVEKLKIEKNCYGIQSVENAYIIWKHKVK